MLDRARTVRNTTEYSYRRGEASLVEFLDAQRAYNETKEFYNTTRANYARSLYLLDAVSGANPERQPLPQLYLQPPIRRQRTYLQLRHPRQYRPRPKR
ncbi:MAG: TolC family protein [Acidobacteriota bacterium]